MTLRLSVLPVIGVLGLQRALVGAVPETVPVVVGIGTTVAVFKAIEVFGLVSADAEPGLLGAPVL